MESESEIREYPLADGGNRCPGHYFTPEVQKLWNEGAVTEGRSRRKEGR
jgi:hypothetical protein